MRLLFIGDVVGKPGREIIRKGLKTVVDAYEVDFVIANIAAPSSVAGKGPAT